jgi:lysophospholipase L1-like esterase
MPLPVMPLPKQPSAWRESSTAEKRLRNAKFFPTLADMRKALPSSLFLLLVSAVLCFGQAKPDPWEKEISAFEASDKTNPPPKGAILFIGSSSIRMWQSLAKDFPDYKVINRGFGGSQIIDSVQFADRIAIPYQPKQIVLYAGGNDINAGKSPEQVFADYKAFVAKIHAALPQAKIDYISIAPNPARWAQVEKVKAANELIAQYTKSNPGLRFIDVYSQMLGKDGQPKPDIYLKDRLHMNAKGYELWTGIIRPYLN